MKITALKIQARNKDRVNVYVDNIYSFSLEIAQVASLGIRTGVEYTDTELGNLKNESQFGKLYARALEYAFVRPRSQREMRDYLFRKTRDKRSKEGAVIPGVSKELTDRVFDRLVDRGYLDDAAFARFWVENRNQRKGSSRRRLQAELAAKGVDRTIIEEALGSGDRSDNDEIIKVIRRKAGRYDDETKLIAYLARQGFGYDDIKTALDQVRDEAAS